MIGEGMETRLDKG